MFRMKVSPTFKGKVTVNVPTEAGGFEKNEFMAVFERVPTDQHDQLRAMTHEQLALRVLKGWEMKDEAGGEVPFTPENLAAALLIAPTPLATASTFWECVHAARAKN